MNMNQIRPESSCFSGGSPGISKIGQTTGACKNSRVEFLDDDFIPRTSSELEKYGFWTRGSHKTEMIIKTFYPIKQITFQLLNKMPEIINAMPHQTAKGKTSPSKSHAQRETSTGTIPRAMG